LSSFNLFKGEKKSKTEFIPPFQRVKLQS